MADDLQTVASAFRSSVPSDGYVSVFRLDPLDRLGVPVVQASLLLPDRPATIGYGYGATEIEAEVGALGELCEEVHVGAWVSSAPTEDASFDEMVRRHGVDHVLDPLTLCLPAGSIYEPDMRLVWTEVRRWPDGAPSHAPLEWIAAYSYQMERPARLVVPITNGLGAGFDLAHAIAHGVMEQLQRDGNCVGYRALDQGVEVELDDVPTEIAALLDRLTGAGIDVMVKLAATDFGLVNLYVVGDDRTGPAEPIQISACGEASHPDRVRALRKALLEFCGSRSRKAASHGRIERAREIFPREAFDRQMAIAGLGEEPRALRAMAEWIGLSADELRRRLAPRVLTASSAVRFSDLPTVDASLVASSVARLDLLTRRLAAEGLSIFYADCSPQSGPVRVVKVIVPGLESETMSYHRIGWRGVRRLRAREDELLLDAPRDGARRVRLRPQDEERAGGPAWLDTAAADAMVDRLYPLYRESGPFAAQLTLRELQATT